MRRGRATGNSGRGRKGMVRMEKYPFRFRSLDEVIRKSRELSLDLHFSADTGILGRPVRVDGFTFQNALVNHPMEGCDGEADGSPSELTRRRYERFARGGAGLIWMEAVAVRENARANPRQLWLRDATLDAFRRLREEIDEAGRRQNGRGTAVILQLTHSGRFSRPQGKPQPIVAAHDPRLDGTVYDDSGAEPIADDDLDRLGEDFEKAALLAERAGFDGVDIKSCHRYLFSELLSAVTRKGRYGGSYENRTRVLLETVARVKDRVGPGFIVTARLNIYDGFPYPYGWGMDREDPEKVDLTEPIRLVRQLEDLGVHILNLTMGCPYINPYVNRPSDGQTQGHPLAAVARLTQGIAAVHKAVPGVAVIGTGYSWLREFAPCLMAGEIKDGGITMAGFGRESFAYPDFARDILEGGGMKHEKCCITCGKCTEIMRAGGTTGCPIRDTEMYLPIYRRLCMKKS